MPVANRVCLLVSNTVEEVITVFRVVADDTTVDVLNVLAVLNTDVVAVSNTVVVFLLVSNAVLKVIYSVTWFVLYVVWNKVDVAINVGFVVWKAVSLNVFLLSKAKEVSVVLLVSTFVEIVVNTQQLSRMLFHNLY